MCLTGWRLQWTLGRADKMPGGRVNARVRGQVRQLVLRAGPYWLTATRTTPCCYISHADTVSKQNNLPLHPKHTQAAHRILARISGQNKGISRSDWEQQKKFGSLVCVPDSTLICAGYNISGHREAGVVNFSWFEIYGSQLLQLQIGFLEGILYSNDLRI